MKANGRAALVDMNEWAVKEIEGIESAAITPDAEAHRIYPDQEYYQALPLFRIGETETFTIGSLSLIVGKAKSKKTFALSLYGASWAQDDETEFGLTPLYREDKKRLIWFDTEMAAHHIQQVQRRIEKLSGAPLPEHMEFYSIRALNTKQRLSFIKKVIDTDNPNDDIGFVVIDGIRDVLSSVNDEAEITRLADWLLGVTTRKGLHICSVLHSNKGATADRTARGWAGAELQNKAELVIVVEKDPFNADVSVINCEMARGTREFDPIAFQIDAHGIPVKAISAKARSSKIDEDSFIEEEHIDLIHTVFKDAPGEGIKYSDLWEKVKFATKDIGGIRAGDTAAKNICKYWKAKGWVSVTGKTTNARWLNSV